MCKWCWQLLQGKRINVVYSRWFINFENIKLFFLYCLLFNSRPFLLQHICFPTRNRKLCICARWEQRPKLLSQKIQSFYWIYRYLITSISSYTLSVFGTLWLIINIQTLNSFKQVVITAHYLISKNALFTGVILFRFFKSRLQYSFRQTQKAARCSLSFFIII